MRVAETATAQKGIKLQVDTMRARRGSAQNRIKRMQGGSPGKDHIPLSAMAKTTETTTDQTSRTETDRIGKGNVMSFQVFHSPHVVRSKHLTVFSVFS